MGDQVGPLTRFVDAARRRRSEIAGYLASPGPGRARPVGAQLGVPSRRRGAAAAGRAEPARPLPTDGGGGGGTKGFRQPGGLHLSLSIFQRH